MNVIQRTNIIKTFRNFGFPNVEDSMLQRLDSHFLQHNKKLIMIISHTCNHDFLLGLLLFSLSSIPIKMFTNFKNPLFKQLSQQLGMITSQKSVSNTQVIIDNLKEQTEYALLIGLGKTREGEKIHSGYFYISRALQVPILVLGFDYFLKTGYVSLHSWLPSPETHYADFQANQEKEILQEICNIWPLKPKLQVGFEPTQYPHYHEAQKTKCTAPNACYLYTQVVTKCLLKTQNYSTTTNLVLLIVASFILLFLIVMLCNIIFTKLKK